MFIGHSTQKESTELLKEFREISHTNFNLWYGTFNGIKAKRTSCQFVKEPCHGDVQGPVSHFSCLFLVQELLVPIGQVAVWAHEMVWR
jgi:hypothetical protein